MGNAGRSSIRGQLLAWPGLLASFLAVGVLVGGARLLPGGPSSGPALRAAAGSVLYVPAGAHASGANGANWRTDLEAFNPGSTTATFTVQLLRRDADNSSPASRSYSLGPRQARRFVDVLLSEFSTDGAAAFRVVVTAGSLAVTSRTYNAIGENPWGLPQGASFGQFVPGLDETEAIAYGQEGRLIHLTQQAATTLDGFRTNVGIVNASPIPIDVRIDFYAADGTWLGKKDGGDTNLPPYGFRQLNEALRDWGAFPDAWAVVKPTTPGGALFAFATVIDNHVSGDPIFVPAARRASSSPAPTPTPTTAPSPTPPGSRPNLYLYRPTAWPSCVVSHSQGGCCNGTSCCSPFLSTWYSTFVQVFLANNGAATLTGPVRLSLAIDGTVVQYANWSNADGLPPGYGIVLTWEYAGAVTAGTHSVTVAVDPEQLVAESNEGDNSCATSATWTTIVFGGPAGTESSRLPAESDVAASVPQRLAPPGVSALAAAGTVYVPASAHASGVNGANWRTDVEVHNPNSTAVSYEVALLRRGAENSSPSVKTFSLGPQQSVRYVDVLASVFGTDGAASLRFVPSGGASILVNSRTYNLIGANGIGLPVGASFSQYVPGLDESTSAISYGEEGRIVQLTHRDAGTQSSFRTNVGFVNTTGSTIDLRLDLYSKAGALLGTIQDARTHLRPYEFLQVDAAFGAYTADLDDGYAIVTTTTPGGRFLAFATVIDNHLTGDPVFVPASRGTASTSPTPTPTPTTPAPTPTPISGTQPVGTIETVNDVMTGLGLAGVGGRPTVESTVRDLQTRGIEAILNDVVAQNPTRVSRVTNGVRIDFGGGYTTENGTVLTGQATLTYSGLVVTSTKVAGTVTAVLVNVTKNGGYATVQNLTANVDLNVTPAGRVSGDVTASGSGTSPVGTTNVTGSVHVDTSVCAKYPVSGSVTVTRGAETKTVTFTPSCDGTYGWTGGGYSPYLFEGQLLKCDGTPQAYSQKVSIAVEGNHLSVNPTCGATGGTKWHYLTGTRSATSVRFAFRSTYTGDRPHLYEGVFQGTSSNGGTSYTGTSTFTVTVTDSSGAVVCSSPPYQKQGTLWLNTAAPCWP